MRVFDKTQKGSLDETEFFALARTLKKLQLESLDENRLRVRFHTTVSSLKPCIRV